MNITNLFFKTIIGCLLVTLINTSKGCSSDTIFDRPTTSLYLSQCSYVGLEKEEIEIMESAYKELSENSIGLKLLSILKEKLAGKPEIVIKRTNSGHAFMPPRANSENIPFYVEIDFEKIKNNNFQTRTGCIGEKVESLETYEVFKIGAAASPFYIALAHELIHLKHFLEDEDLFRRFQKSFTDELWGIYEGEQRAELIWRNLEEQRTVIGPDLDDISELTIRLAANYAPRYAYQEEAHHFYESNKVISKILLKYLASHPLNSLLRLNWQFDEENAKLSRYNPKELQNTYEELYKLKEDSDRQDLAAANAQVSSLQQAAQKRLAAILKRSKSGKK